MTVAALAYISHSKAEKAFGGPDFRKTKIVTRKLAKRESIGGSGCWYCRSSIRDGRNQNCVGTSRVS